MFVAGLALLAAAAFEVVAGAGSGWGRIPAALVLLAAAGLAGWAFTRESGPPVPAAAKPAARAPSAPIEFGGVADPQIETIARETVDGLPPELRAQISNLAFVIEDEPPPGKAWLGLYQGIPLTQKSELRGWDWPHKITLYRGPLRRLYGSNPQLFEHEVTHVVRHELAHYFGISDERLVEIGRY